MDTHYDNRFYPRGVQGSLDREDLLESVMMLRNDFNSMASDMRAVMQENVQLKERLIRMQDDRETKQSSVSEIKRLKKELDTLLNAHRSRGPVTSPWAAPPSSGEEGGRGHSGGNDWLRKMMMVMMISQMV